MVFSVREYPEAQKLTPFSEFRLLQEAKREKERKEAL